MVVIRGGLTHSLCRRCVKARERVVCGWCGKGRRRWVWAGSGMGWVIGVSMYIYICVSVFIPKEAASVIGRRGEGGLAGEWEDRGRDENANIYIYMRTCCVVMRK